MCTVLENRSEVVQPDQNVYGVSDYLVFVRMQSKTAIRKLNFTIVRCSNEKHLLGGSSFSNITSFPSNSFVLSNLHLNNSNKYINMYQKKAL